MTSVCYDSEFAEDSWNPYSDANIVFGCFNWHYFPLHAIIMKITIPMTMNGKKGNASVSGVGVGVGAVSPDVLTVRVSERTAHIFIVTFYGVNCGSALTSVWNFNTPILSAFQGML